jgi:hypothetical protein
MEGEECLGKKEMHTINTDHSFKTINCKRRDTVREDERVCEEDEDFVLF